LPGTRFAQFWEVKPWTLPPMCNEAARRIALDQLRADWSEIRIPLRFPEGLPNMAPLDSIRITDPTVIIRAAKDAPGEAEVITRRWSWPSPNGKPVYNFRSDGREFRNTDAGGRCLGIISQADIARAASSADGVVTGEEVALVVEQISKPTNRKARGDAPVAEEIAQQL